LLNSGVHRTGTLLASPGPEALVPTILQDLRYAARVMRKSPLLTSVILVTVALCVGANTAVFAVVEAALLRPLPYPDAERIVVAADLAPGEIVDWRAQSNSFSSVAALRDGFFDLTGRDRPQRVTGVITDASFFDVMGVNPALGRPFTVADEGAHVVVLSDALWRTAFGGDPKIIGRPITLNDEAFIVVGVMPARFGLSPDIQLWMPPRHVVPDHPQRPGVDLTRDHGSHYLGAYARLKSGVSLAAAQQEQRAIFTRMIKQFPSEMIAGDEDVPLVPLRDWIVGDIKPALLVLVAVVALVLLIGCANIANLLLARASARAHEMSVRAALGAGRSRIVRQLITESVLLAAVGGGLGMLTAAWTLPLIATLSPADLSSVHASLNVYVVSFALAVSVAMGLVFGCVPALHASRTRAMDALRSQGRTTDGRASGRFRRALIVGECAASVTLLVLAGLLIRSFDSLTHVNPGFDPAGRQTARIVLPPTRYSTPAMQTQFFDRLLEQVRAVPGVSSAAVAARLPFVSGNSTRGLTLDHAPSAPNPIAGLRVVSAGYFGVVGQRLVRGREFTDRDVRGAAPVAVVNETMAKQFWPNQDVIGHHFQIGTAQPPIEVVGVVADVKHASLREPMQAEFYQPYPQAPWSFMTLVVKTPLTAAETSAALDRVLARLDAALPTPTVRPMDSLIATSVSMDRFDMIGLVSFAVVGLTLAVIGLYGVMSYLVSRRTSEIGLRMALGATPTAVVRLVMRDGLTLTAAGVSIGLAGSLVAARAIRTWLFGVGPNDPLTLLTVAVLLSAIAALACYVPARRAMTVDPISALRAD
jgi:putative ABC transport system permease protein